MYLISESDLYKPIMRSDKPEARKFQDWVTRVVLPSIRKHGGYTLGQEKAATGGMSETELFARALKATDSFLAEKAKNAALERENAYLAGALTDVSVECKALRHERRPVLGPMALRDHLTVAEYLTDRRIRNSGQSYRSRLSYRAKRWPEIMELPRRPLAVEDRSARHEGADHRREG